MSEPKKESIKTYDGELIVTERQIKHPKSGELVDYISFSDGISVTGVFLSEETKKELSKFLNRKEVKNGSRSNTTK